MLYVVYVKLLFATNYMATFKASKKMSKSQQEIICLLPSYYPDLIPFVRLFKIQCLNETTLSALFLLDNRNVYLVLIRNISKRYVKLIWWNLVDAVMVIPTAS